MTSIERHLVKVDHHNVIKMGVMLEGGLTSLMSARSLVIGDSYPELFAKFPQLLNVGPLLNRRRWWKRKEF